MFMLGSCDIQEMQLSPQVFPKLSLLCPSLFVAGCCVCIRWGAEEDVTGSLRVSTSNGK